MYIYKLFPDFVNLFLRTCTFTNLTKPIIYMYNVLFLKLSSKCCVLHFANAYSPTSSFVFLVFPMIIACVKTVSRKLNPKIVIV